MQCLVLPLHVSALICIFKCGSVAPLVALLLATSVIVAHSSRNLVLWHFAG